MYPQVTQLETRDRLVREELELLQMRRASEHDRRGPGPWRRARGLVLFVSTSSWRRLPEIARIEAEEPTSAFTGSGRGRIR
jgi:hypothetical protein